MDYLGCASRTDYLLGSTKTNNTVMTPEKSKYMHKVLNFNDFLLGAKAEWDFFTNAKDEYQTSAEYAEADYGHLNSGVLGKKPQ